MVTTQMVGMIVLMMIVLLNAWDVLMCPKTAQIWVADRSPECPLLCRDRKPLDEPNGELFRFAVTNIFTVTWRLDDDADPTLSREYVRDFGVDRLSLHFFDGVSDDKQRRCRPLFRFDLANQSETKVA